MSPEDVNQIVEFINNIQINECPKQSLDQTIINLTLTNIIVTIYNKGVADGIAVTTKKLFIERIN